MKKNGKKLAAVCLAGGLLAAQVTGCGQKDVPGAAGDGSAVAQERPVQTEEQTEDLDTAWDPQTATSIACDDSGITVDGAGASVSESTVTISRAGTYVVTGTMMDGQILIDTGKDETVHLILSGAELSNRTTAPVYSMGKGTVILTLEEGTTNTISDSTQYEYASEAEDEPDAPVFIKGDLTINGTGALAVYGNYQCGIRSKGDLTVASGTLNIQAESDGLKGRDSVVIRDGILTIQSGKDGIKSNNDEESDKGYIRVDGGQITIAAQDDGIQAETRVVINGGEIQITESAEGIAGLTVDILGGVIDIVSSDDGINSAANVETEQEKMIDQEGVYTRIAGGEVTINAAADGIDSNGDFYMEGGTLYLNGPTSGGDGILDYNGKGTITGGTFFGVGSAGMMQTFDETTSTQNFLVVYFTETKKAGTTVVLTDAGGTELGRIEPEKEYSAAIISTPDIQIGNTYRVSVGEDTMELQVEGIMTIYGTASGRGMGGPGGGGHGQGGRQTPPDGQMPPDNQAPDGAGFRGGNRLEGGREDEARPDTAPVTGV